MSSSESSDDQKKYKKANKNEKNFDMPLSMAKKFVNK